MLLRPAGPSDEPFLLGLFAATRAPELALVAPPEMAATLLDLQYRAQRQHVAAAHPGAAHLIICTDARDGPGAADGLGEADDSGGEACGRLVYALGTDELRLIVLALLPAARGAGLGTRAVEHVQARARAAGVPVVLHVDAGNPARRLYGRLGFTATAEDEVRIRMEWR